MEAPTVKTTHLKPGNMTCTMNMRRNLSLCILQMQVQETVILGQEHEARTKLTMQRNNQILREASIAVQTAITLRESEVFSMEKRIRGRKD